MTGRHVVPLLTLMALPHFHPPLPEYCSRDVRENMVPHARIELWIIMSTGTKGGQSSHLR